MLGKVFPFVVIDALALVTFLSRWSIVVCVSNLSHNKALWRALDRHDEMPGQPSRSLCLIPRIWCSRMPVAFWTGLLPRMQNDGNRAVHTRNVGILLPQPKCCNDTDCTHGVMKQAFFALTGGDWEEKAFLEMKWKHCPRNHNKKYRSLAAHYRASGEARRRHDVILVPAFNSFPLDDCVWWVSGGEKHVVCDLWR